MTAQAGRRILLNPELALGEIWMDGSFVVENGSIADVLAIVMDQPELMPALGQAAMVAALPDPTH